MKKVLQFIKQNTIGFIAGLVVAGSIGVYAVSVASSDVTYDNTASGSSATTVKAAIDDLYTRTESSVIIGDILDGFEISIGSYTEREYVWFTKSFILALLNEGYHIYIRLSDPMSSGDAFVDFFVANNSTDRNVLNVRHLEATIVKSVNYTDVTNALLDANITEDIVAFYAYHPNLTPWKGAYMKIAKP